MIRAARPSRSRTSWRRPTRTKARLRELRIRTDADVLHVDHIDESTDVLGIFHGCVGQVRPDTNCASNCRNDLGLFFTDEPATHHLCNVRIIAKAGIEPGVGDDHGSSSDFERGLSCFQ